MAANKKFLIIGSAAVLAIGGAGLYAGSLTVSTTGGSGSDTVDVSASCAATATITANEATWNATAEDFTFDGVKLELPDANTCGQQVAKIVLYNTTDGSIVAETASTNLGGTANAAVYTTDGGTPISFTGTPPETVSAGINNATHSWGIVIQK